MWRRSWVGLVLWIGCKESDPIEDEPTPLPLWGIDPVFTQIASGSDDLATPRDLAFHPDRPEQLFVVNRDTDSVTVIFDPGAAGQRTEPFADAFGNHFMEEVSSLAFGDKTAIPGAQRGSSFATCQESRNTYDDQGEPNDFMGPALWPGELDILAQVHQDDGLLGSHLDMLHQSSFCMGIAHDEGNAYWVFDGQDERIMFYDFQEPHGIGEDDHSNGIVREYPEASVRRVRSVPSHLELDVESQLLYVADTGNGRILVVDTATGEAVRDLPLTNEPLDEFSEMGGVDVHVLVDGLGEPSGVARHEGLLFVSDHQTGEIIAFELDGTEVDRIAVPDGPGIMGLAIGPDGTLWYADGQNDLVVHVEPG